MSRLKAKIKYNDGIWREQYLPSTTESFKMYNYLVKFKELGYIQDFKLLLIKQANNKIIEVDIKDILGEIWRDQYLPNNDKKQANKKENGS